jgi:hypothetical protein
MMKFLAAVFSLMLMVGCEAQPSGPSAAALPTAGRDKALPIISVDGSEIKINGTSVWLGDTLAEWKRVIGGTPTCYDAGLIVTCVWHSNGLSLGSGQTDKTRVEFMNLHLTIEPAELGERAPSWPQFPFHGTLLLDGVPINPNTQFQDLRRKVTPRRELRCGGSDCGNPSAAFSDAANIYMNLAGRSENSRILHFSVSCSSIEACIAQIPVQRKK